LRPTTPNSSCPVCGSLMIWQDGVEVCPYLHDEDDDDDHDDDDIDIDDFFDID
jgi:hypothetical protein